MCKFFSCTSNGKGKLKYFTWEQRKQILNNEFKIGSNLITEADSHSSILEYEKHKIGYIGDIGIKRNKYEYNPITKKFIIDQINTKDDSEIIKKKCMNLDFSKIVEPLIIHGMINPFKDKSVIKIYKKNILLLKKWASVRDSVWDYVWASFRASVRASVWDSVWAYTSSYFNIEKWKYTNNKSYKNPFQSCIDLWNRGIVPSFDGKMWRLHGHEGKVIWEDNKHEIC